MRQLLGDGTHFDDAYRLHMPRAKAAAERVLHDPCAAEDVAQEVFMDLWRRPDAYDPRRSSLSTYIALVARSRAVDRLRSRAALSAATERSRTQAERTAVQEAETPVDLVLVRERRRQVLGALDRLPRDQREALLLAYGLGMSTREVAQAVDIPVGTAKSRMRLGLSKARTALAAAA